MAHADFERAEFAHRVERLRARVRAAGAQVALFDEIEAIAYLAGHSNTENRWHCVVVPLEAEPFAIIRALDATPLRERSWIADIRTFRDWEDPFPLLRAGLEERGLAAAPLGIDFNSYAMTHGRFLRLGEALPGLRLVDLGAAVWELRLIKSPAELGLLRAAAAIADAALERAAAACVPGASQRDAARAASDAFIALGGDPGPPGPISAGRGWDFLHAHLEDATLAPGDVVHIELTPRVAGYSARIMRCVSVGPPDPALAAAAATLERLQTEQIAAMRPGAQARDVDRILRDGVLRAGLREGYDNITGYTLGFYDRAGPRTSDFTRIFTPVSDWRLEPGMVFHMYASAARVSFSETVLVAEDGPERLTRFPRTLLVNPIKERPP